MPEALPAAPPRPAGSLAKAPTGIEGLDDVTGGGLPRGRQTEHLRRLVDDLLDVSRITSGKVELRKEVIDAAALVARAVEISRPHVDAKRHDLSVTLPDRALLLHADPLRMAQVLGNLLTNAAKYTDEGGRIWLTVEPEGDDLIFRVRDTGVGIPPSLLTSIFDLFMQVNPSVDRSQGGLGIGLTLVRSLVAMHGGTVHALSSGERSSGSEFVVRVPALPALRALPPGSASARPAPGVVPCRILVVDDNVDGAETLTELLTLGGHDVRFVHDGPRALAEAARFRPRVVLLDIGLPGMDGYEVARRLRVIPEARSALIVALTGYGQEQDRVRSFEAGFDRHLVKPLDVKLLDSLLSNVR